MKLLALSISVLAIAGGTLEYYSDKNCEFENRQIIHLLTKETRFVQCTLNHVIVHRYGYGYISIPKDAKELYK